MQVTKTPYKKGQSGSAASITTSEKVDKTPAEQTPKPAAPAHVTPLTDEELLKKKRDLELSMGWSNPTAEEIEAAKPKEEPPQEEVVETEEEKTKRLADEADAENKRLAEEEEKKKAAAAPAAPAPDPEPESSEDLINRTAKATATEVARALTPKAPAPEPGPAPFKLNSDDERDLRVIQMLEHTKPEYKEKGVAQKYIDFVKARYERIAAWEKANPGASYDPESQENVEWAEKHEPDIDPEHFVAAEKDLDFKDRYERQVKPEIESMKNENLLQKHEPVFRQQVAVSNVEMLKELDPEWAKIFQSANGDPVINQETVNKFKETTDMATFAIIDKYTRRLGPLIVELEKTTVPGLNYKFDLANNPVHQELQWLVDESEKLMATDPEAPRVQNGKQFKTFREMADLKKGVMAQNLPAAQKEKMIDGIYDQYFTLDTEDIKKAAIKIHAKRAKKELADLDEVVQSRMKKAGVPAATQTPPPAAPAAVPAVKHKGPSLSAQSDKSNTSGKTTQQGKNFADTAVNVLFGG